MSKLLSLCIPTNGVVEWVIPVLESILNQNVDDDLYEIVISDNGSNDLFEKELNKYLIQHNNIIYKKSNSNGFLNQIDCFKMASGSFVKFVNHRAKLIDGSLEMLINFINNNKEKQPVVFFSNGSLKHKDMIQHYNNFDSFVRSLGIYSSWSGGIGIWKAQLSKIIEIKNFNVLFPHTDILFSDKTAKYYVINNNLMFDEIDVGHEKKGKYNVFYAFAIEYPSILMELMKSRYISIQTFNYLLRENRKFVTNLYRNFIFLKKPCSYILDDYKDYINVFYSEKQMKIAAYFPPIFRRV